MKKYIGCDAHARYSIFASLREDGRWDPLVRVEHDEGEMERFLKQLPAGSPVALESSGNWYWLVRAMEEAGLAPDWRMRWRRKSACQEEIRRIIWMPKGWP
jgi:hypothetical protein